MFSSCVLRIDLRFGTTGRSAETPQYKPEGDRTSRKGDVIESVEDDNMTLSDGLKTCDLNLCIQPRGRLYNRTHVYPFCTKRIPNEFVSQCVGLILSETVLIQGRGSTVGDPGSGIQGQGSRVGPSISILCRPDTTIAQTQQSAVSLYKSWLYFPQKLHKILHGVCG